MEYIPAAKAKAGNPRVPDQVVVHHLAVGVGLKVALRFEYIWFRVCIRVVQDCPGSSRLVHVLFAVRELHYQALPMTMVSLGM
jgi:hypothetical protein